VTAPTKQSNTTTNNNNQSTIEVKKKTWLNFGSLLVERGMDFSKSPVWQQSFVDRICGNKHARTTYSQGNNNLKFPQR